jgi:hypothetical protein
MTDTNEMKSYRANVERLADMQSPEVFSNGRPEHAVIILETFCKYARERVVVFCQRLSQRTYGGSGLINVADAALRRGVAISLVTQEAPESQGFIDAAKRWKDEALPISLSRAQDTPSLKVNFAVMDQKAYRFEGNRNVPEAIACMNDPETSKSLLLRFRHIEKQSSDILSVTPRVQVHPA